MQASEALLQQSYRDRSVLEQENTALQRRLAQMASKLGLGTSSTPLNNSPAAADALPATPEDAPSKSGKPCARKT